MSEELKELLCLILKLLEPVVQKTKNPIDDMVVRALRALLGCKS